MGREIRRVPANWEHPRVDCGCNDAKAHDGKCYQPMRETNYETAAQEWLENCHKWEDGTHEDLVKHPEYKQEHPHWWEYDGDPPDPDYYVHYSEDECEWWQVYETVSEGTPTTPAFATKEELIDYLVNNGDFWDQWRGDGGWSRENAEDFVNAGWAPSLVVRATKDGLEIKSPRDGSLS